MTEEKRFKHCKVSVTKFINNFNYAAFIGRCRTKFGEQTIGK